MGRRYGEEEDFVQLRFHSAEGMHAAATMLSRPVEMQCSETQERVAVEVELMESAIDPVMRFMTDRCDHARPPAPRRFSPHTIEQAHQRSVRVV